MCLLHNLAASGRFAE